MEGFYADKGHRMWVGQGVDNSVRSTEDEREIEIRFYFSSPLCFLQFEPVDLGHLLG